MDNGPELLAEEFVAWCERHGIEPRYIQPVDQVAVPEPATLALLGVALAGLGFGRRRKLH